MRNIEPPCGRGSATNCLLMRERNGAIAAMNSDMVPCTDSRKRDLFASNQARSLFAFNSRKKVKKSFGKPGKSSSARGYNRTAVKHQSAGEVWPRNRTYGAVLSPENGEPPWLRKAKKSSSSYLSARERAYSGARRTASS